PYAVYCTLIDKAGNLWMGTQSMGVCRYDGSKFTWFTEHGLAGPAVLALFEDKSGNIWFGNNGSGLFRYEPVKDVLTNFTKEHNLSNEEFRISGKQGPGTMARIYSVNEDRNGNLWIGTVDAGVWRYDGHNLKNYTTLNGLPSDAVISTFRDKDGELWFGTEAGVCTFNGISFARFAIP
ncbi:MAG TPA: two-component regulator propeller domain-containing protein, partial [Saprospiraceae bacterium]|nr:two-component regulator propeller domain-containing protein [Saprospiraceae bacterium]